jgi:MerR family transcriptional regulator, copper efflux regulator
VRPLPILCSLDGDSLGDRLAEWKMLVARAVAVERTAHGGRVRFSAAAGVESDARDLARREQRCCPFFDIRVRQRSGEVWLDRNAPDEARPAVEILLGLTRPARDAAA